MRITTKNINDVFRSKRGDIDKIETKGYKWVTNFFVDSSGLGEPGEPALSADQFIAELKELLRKHPTVYTWIVDQGMFQVYVGVFIKPKRV